MPPGSRSRSRNPAASQTSTISPAWPAAATLEEGDEVAAGFQWQLPIHHHEEPVAEVADDAEVPETPEQPASAPPPWPK